MLQQHAFKRYQGKLYSDSVHYFPATFPVNFYNSLAFIFIYCRYVCIV